METILQFNVTVTFDLVTSKLIGVIYYSWQTYIWNIKTLWYILFKKINGKHFDIEGQWPWPSDPKINRGHLLVMANLHVKYEDFVLYTFQEISGNHFDIQGHCDLDLWSSNPKFNRGHLLIMTNLHVKYEDCVTYFSRN